MPGENRSKKEGKMEIRRSVCKDPEREAELNAITEAVYNAFEDHVPLSEMIQIAISDGVEAAFTKYLEKHGLPGR
jgi:hypothetical protein